LTNAAGNSSITDAAHTTLDVTAGEPGSNSGSKTSGTGSQSITHGGATPPKPPLRVSEALHGRELAVQITGPSKGTVYISYTVHYHGKLVAKADKKAILLHGKLRVVFRLSTHAAIYATIQVVVKLSHYKTVIDTLHHKLRSLPRARATHSSQIQYTAIAQYILFLAFG
jgi:hypothetical protein